MATMEVSIETYKAMLNKIEGLEKDLVTANKEKKKLHLEIEELKENLEIFREANWVDRTFKWKQILKLTSTSDEQ